MAFDPIRDEIVTFGGILHTLVVTDETWTFKEGRWTQLHPAHVPPARDDAALVFDSARGNVVMYGGRDVLASVAEGHDISTFIGDTWTWDGSDWTQQHPAHHPVLFEPDSTYDYARNQLVLVGFDGQMETWTYDGTDWTHHLTAVEKPDPPRVQSWLSFDAASHAVVTFGGHNDGGADVSAVWEWDGETWKETATKAPPVQYFGPMAPEFDHNSMLLYDYHSFASSGASTWRWNGSAFRHLQPAHTPMLVATSLRADPPRHRLLLYGSTLPDEQFQVWSWSGEDWTQITP